MGESSISANTNLFGGSAGTITIESTNGGVDLTNHSAPITANATIGTGGHIIIKAATDITVGGAGISASTGSPGLFSTKSGSIDISSSNPSAKITLKAALSAAGAPGLIAFRNTNGGKLNVVVDAPIASGGAIAFSSAGDIVVQQGSNLAGTLVAGAGVFVGQLSPSGDLVGGGLAGAANSIDINMLGFFEPAPAGISITSALALNDIRVQSTATSLTQSVESNNGNVVIFGQTRIDNSAKVRAGNGFISMQTPILNHTNDASYSATGNVDLLGRFTLTSGADANENLTISGQPWTFDSKNNLRIVGTTVTPNSMGLGKDSNVQLSVVSPLGSPILTVGPSSGVATVTGNLEIQLSGGPSEIRGNSTSRGILSGGKITVSSNNDHIKIDGVDIQGLESTTIRGFLGTSLANAKVTGTQFVDILAGPDRSHGTHLGSSSPAPFGFDISGSGTVQFFGNIGVTVGAAGPNTVVAPEGRSVTFDAAQNGIDIGPDVEIRAEFQPISFSETSLREGALSKKHWQTPELNCLSIGMTTLKQKGKIISINDTGELLLIAKNDFVISLLNSEIKVARGTILHLTVSTNEITIRNLHDNIANSLILQSNKRISIAPGAELTLSENDSSIQDGIARRRTKIFKEKHGFVQIAEYSLPSLLRCSQLYLLLPKGSPVFSKVIKR